MGAGGRGEMEQFDEERCGNLTWEYHQVSGAARRDLTK